MPAPHDKPDGVEEEPKSKRQRTAMACDSCRSRKTRCDGTRPCCGVCSDMGFRCVYTRPARVSMNPIPESEQTSRIEDRLLNLEQMLRSVISKNEVANQANDIRSGRLQDDSSSSSNNNLSVAGYNPNSLLNLPYAIGTDILPNAGPLVQTVGPLNDTVDGMGVITFADEVASGYFGPTSNSDFFYHISNAVTEAGQPGLPQSNAPTVSNTDTSYISRPPSPPALPRGKYRLTYRAEPVDCFALPPEAKIIQLVDSFFAGTGSMFPYIYKKSVLDGLAEMKTTHPLGVRRTWLCLLNTIMAFATCVTTISHERRENCAAEADVFLQRALKLLPNIALTPANLEAFQAMILVTQYLQGTQHSAQTWNLQGLTVQAAFQIGVHCPSEGLKSTRLDQEIRKRCWFMCFILDKTCSMTFGRPPSISNDYLQTEMPLEVDLETLDSPSRQNIDEAADSGPSTVSMYTQTIKLYKIVTDIMEKVYQNNIKRERQISSSGLFQQIISIEQLLATWKSELPSHLCVITIEELLPRLQDPSVFTPFSTVITLRYLSTRTLLHRAMVTRFLDYNGQKDSKGEEWSFLHDFGRTSLEVCVRSAAEMIEIIHTASEGGYRMLTTWWFSIYYIFSSALIIFAAILVKHKHGLQISIFEFSDFTNSLLRALQTLEYLGDNTRIATRCRKYLQKLVEVASIITGTASPNAPPEHFDGIAIPMTDFSDFPPPDLDLGPFSVGDNWDIFTQSMNTDFLGLPFQKDTVLVHQ